MSPTIRAVQVEPGRPPYAIQLPNDLKSMQAIVGGYLEPVHRVQLDGDRQLVFLANEDGLRLGLQPNRTVGTHDIVGPLLIVAVQENVEVSLTEDEVAIVKRHLGR